MTTGAGRNLHALTGGAALFLGAVLTFWLQPMVGRLLLPAYGGAAAVWAVCLAAFQALLLAGYAYAYALTHLPRWMQRVVHSVLLVLVVAWSWRGAAPVGVPTDTHVSLAALRDVWLLAGPVFVVVAAGSTLLQNWHAPAAGNRGVYRLYALSNLGSLAGLLIYPLLLEPFTSVGTQRHAWSSVLTGYALLVSVTAWHTWRHETRLEGVTEDLRACSATPPDAVGCLPTRAAHPVWWFALPALSSALLVSVTAHVTMQIIALPLVWAVLLGAFLLSYVVGFGDFAERHLGWLRMSLLGLLAFAPVTRLHGGSMGLALLAIGYGTLLMAVAGAWLHGWLYSIRPDSRRLPRFYLALAAGGATGGALATFAAPALFRGMYELPILLTALAALALAWEVSTTGLSGASTTRRTAWLTVAVSVLVVLVGSLYPPAGTLHQARDFFGYIRVWETRMNMASGRHGMLRELSHGATCHGRQFDLPGWRQRPLTYFGAGSGVELALNAHPKRVAAEPMRVGVVGLGVGSLASYGHTGDDFIFYEISRPVIDVATNRTWFTYLSDCPAATTLQLGDGRKLLEREAADGAPLFDVLVLDAFAGDSPPLHLLTVEALDLYRRRLAPGGILAMNITNWHIDFLPLCKALAASANLHVDAFLTPPRHGQLQELCVWALLSREPLNLTPPPGVLRAEWKAVRVLPAPSDARGSALRFLAVGRGSMRAFESSTTPPL